MKHTTSHSPHTGIRGTITRALLSFGMLTAICSAEPYPPLDIRLIGANPGAQAPTNAAPLPASLFLGGQPATVYHHVYPGIALAHYTDGHHIEFAFALSQGADPSLIRFMLEGAEITLLSPEGHIVYQAEDIEIYQHAPVVRQPQTTSSTTDTHALAANYTLAGKNEARIATPTLHTEQLASMNHTYFNIVPGEVGTTGPTYDFYMSRFEMTNRQLIRFLNDAEQNPNNARGNHMFFDEAGNVWFHPDKLPGNHEMFLRDAERVLYHAERVRGDRYSLVTDEQGQQPYADHPATGISWYGALKYCNWLTLVSGRGLEQRAYREGTNTFDWAPVTSTNWMNGTFTQAERQAWLTFQGFRLPMSRFIDENTYSVTNTFNEFYKAAAWNGKTNTVYGFGRNTAQESDAAVPDTVLRHALGLMPVGFFDGMNRLPYGPTQTNENGFGIHDLTGNVSEWLNDPPRPGTSGARLVAGGSFQSPLQPVDETRMVAPHTSDTAGGLRPVTTYMPPSTTLLNVLFCFHTANDVPDHLREKYGIPRGDAQSDSSAGPVGLIPDALPDRSDESMGIIPPDTEEQAAVDGLDASGFPSTPDFAQPKPGPSIPEATDPFTPGGRPGPRFPPTPGTGSDPTDPPLPPVPVSLTVRSLGPLGDLITTIDATVDNNGVTTGNTTFPLEYGQNTSVTLTAPPSSSGFNFSHWLIDGINAGSNQTLTFVILNDTEVIAVYVEPVPSP